MTITINEALWNKIKTIVDSRLSMGTLNKPIVFALYTPEDNHHSIIDFKEITSVKIRGDYVNNPVPRAQGVIVKPQITVAALYLSLFPDSLYTSQ